MIFLTQNVLIIHKFGFEYKSYNEYAESAKHKYNKRLINFFEKIFNYEETLNRLKERYKS